MAFNVLEIQASGMVERKHIGATSQQRQAKLELLNLGGNAERMNFRSIPTTNIVSKGKSYEFLSFYVPNQVNLLIRFYAQK